MLECLNDFNFPTFVDLNIVQSWELKRITTFLRCDSISLFSEVFSFKHSNIQTFEHSNINK